MVAEIWQARLTTSSRKSSANHLERYSGVAMPDESRQAKGGQRPGNPRIDRPAGWVAQFEETTTLKKCGTAGPPGGKGTLSASMPEPVASTVGTSVLSSQAFKSALNCTV